jgi:hypothetical protein
MTIDITRIIEKIVPKADGEDTVRWRTGIVAVVNATTLDVTISGVTVTDVKMLKHVSATVDDIAHMVSYRGTLVVIGVVTP